MTELKRTDDCCYPSIPALPISALIQKKQAKPFTFKPFHIFQTGEVIEFAMIETSVDGLSSKFNNGKVDYPAKIVAIAMPNDKTYHSQYPYSVEPDYADLIGKPNCVNTALLPAAAR